MQTSWATQWSGHLSASFHLFAVSLHRLLRSRQSIVSLLLLAFASLAVIAWSLRHKPPAGAGEFIRDIVLTVHIVFLLPIYCLSYATTGIASEREEGTLVYLLVTPLPRPLIFLAKAGASLLMSLAWTMGSLATLCLLAGKTGRESFPVLWSAVFWSTIAYVALFLLFSVLFRRATIVAMAYALFLETFVGNVPGIAKRVAISFHARCILFENAANAGIPASSPANPELFLAISGTDAHTVLCYLSSGLLLLSLVIFSIREYAK